jgi:hypothetical protein
MGELYQESADFLAESELKDRVSLTFVDVLTDELEGHAASKQALELGASQPFDSSHQRLLLAPYQQERVNNNCRR